MTAKVNSKVPCLAFLLFLLALIALPSALAGVSPSSPVGPVGLVAGSRGATLSGQTLLANTTIFSGDNLEVGNGVAVVAVGTRNRVILGQDTAASFSREPQGVTVLLTRGNVSMFHPENGSSLRVEADEVSITPAPGIRSKGDIAIVEESLVITAREGSLQVDDDGETTSVTKGHSIVIKPQAGSGGHRKRRRAAAAMIFGGVPVPVLALAGGMAASAAASASANATSNAVCVPPTVPTSPTASTVAPLAGTSGPVCPQ